MKTVNMRSRNEISDLTLIIGRERKKQETRDTSSNWNLTLSYTNYQLHKLRLSLALFFYEMINIRILVL